MKKWSKQNEANKKQQIVNNNYVISALLDQLRTVVLLMFFVLQKQKKIKLNRHEKVIVVSFVWVFVNFFSSAYIH